MLDTSVDGIAAVLLAANDNDVAVLNAQVLPVETEGSSNDDAEQCDDVSDVGGDTASLRFKELSNDSARLQIAEESSHDRERWHVKEDVAYLAGVEGSFTLDTIA